MSNILADAGRAQLEVLDERVKASRDVFDRYIEALKLIERFQLSCRSLRERIRIVG